MPRPVPGNPTRAVHTMAGFALPEYVVPQVSHKPTVFGGTMPKESGEKSSFMARVVKAAGATPGPEKYDIVGLDAKRWTKGGMGGKFCKLPRDARTKLAAKMPAVGQYHVEPAMERITPRTMGGPMSKGDRSSSLWDTAAHRSRKTPAPGKYELAPADPKEQKLSPVFQTKKTESRGGKKSTVPGPGDYTPQFQLTETKVPNWSSSKADAKTFIDKLEKDKAKLPAPGHRDLVDSKLLDRVGMQHHTANLLVDRSGSA